MPSALRVCATPSCTTLVVRGHCATHQRARRTEQRRFHTGIAGIGYGRRWRRARDAYLAANPLCEGFPRGCHAGVPTMAAVLDHVVPHRGDPELFWDSEHNWAGLCERCHNRKTAGEVGFRGP
jgi:5-methylcytosine-specific restriction enzyme A